MVSADHPLRGMCGGDDAIPYSNHFEVGSPNERKIEHTAQDLLPGGAVIAYQHGGGAGFGHALLRDPEAVKEDVLDEYVSIEAARSKYGVVLTGTLENYDLTVDRPATEALRKQMGAEELQEAAE
jgi:N-methylhydantoinase B